MPRLPASPLILFNPAPRCSTPWKSSTDTRTRCAEIIAEALVRKKREDDIALSVQLQAERRAAAAATRTVAAADGSIDARLRAPELRERAL